MRMLFSLLQEVELKRNNGMIYLYERRQRLNASKQTRALNRCTTKEIYFPKKEREPFRR